MTNRHSMGTPRKGKSCAHQHNTKACEAARLPAASHRTFRQLIEPTGTACEEFERRYGRHSACLKFRVFDRPTFLDRPLPEVEIDPCLVDLIVTHPLTGRPLGRPWLTALLDRATRVVLGARLSFEVPSYASLPRAGA